MRPRWLTPGTVLQVGLVILYSALIFFGLNEALQPAIRGQMALGLGFILMVITYWAYIRLRYGAEVARNARIWWLPPPPSDMVVPTATADAALTERPGSEPRG
jgi:hypothetical protein